MDRQEKCKALQLVEFSETEFTFDCETSKRSVAPDMEGHGARVFLAHAPQSERVPFAFHLDYIHLVALQRNTLKFPVHILGAFMRHKALKGHIISFVNNAALQPGLNRNVKFCLNTHPGYIFSQFYRGMHWFSCVVGVRVALTHCTTSQWKVHVFLMLAFSVHIFFAGNSLVKVWKLHVCRIFKFSQTNWIFINSTILM